MTQTTLQVVPINGVVFPHQTVQLFIPSNSSLFRTNLIGTNIGICFQRDPTRKNSILSYLTDIGIIIRVTDEITETNKGDGRQHKMIRGAAMKRFKLRNFLPKMQCLSAEVELLPDENPVTKDDTFFKDDVVNRLKDQAYKYIELVAKDQLKIKAKLDLIRSENNLTKLHYIVASYLEIKDEEKCRLLEIEDVRERIVGLVSILEGEIKAHESGPNGNRYDDTSSDSPKAVISANIKRSQENNTVSDTNHKETDFLETKLNNAGLPLEAYKTAMQELNRFKQMDSHSNEYHIQRRYLETLSELPWNRKSQEIEDINHAEKILNDGHAGLEKIKERILEFLAVKILKKNSKGSIICLQGPPGVGKTSLGKSIAESLGRKFERIALGGVQDEAEVRGHRRTYVGAMPGALIQGLLKCQTNNPVILLDEIDKLGKNASKGDPSAAMLEVLDPNQNHTFKDHYLGVPFDLSNILFIATSNSLENIPLPLLDRMEVINLSGYTIQEKIEIASKYLVPRQLKENGINKSHARFSKKSIGYLASHYTSEAGVRNLGRVIGSICRKVAFDYLKFKKDTDDQQDFNSIGCVYFPTIQVTERFIQEALGPKIYDNTVSNRIDQPGVAIGLAWTSTGGRVLFVEAAKSSGNGKIEITGQLGSVMKESVLTALGWIKAHPELIYLLTNGKHLQNVSESITNVPSNLLINKHDLHIHFPAAAIPKDGPSAGITIAITLVSLLTDIKVRNDVAMTGEITLTGNILPVGGIKEKCLAAYESGIKRVILSEGNRKDVLDIPEEIRQNLRIDFAQHISDAITLALDTELTYKELHNVVKYKRSSINSFSKL